MENVAVCKFCGQTYCSDATSEESLMRAAIMQCDCPGAVAQKKKWERIDIAKQELKDVLNFNPTARDEQGGNYGEYVEVIEGKLSSFIEHLIDFEIAGITVSITGVGKISMQIGNKSEIKIKKQITQSYESKV